MAQTLLLIGSGVFLILGIGHGVLITRDLWKPRAFTPTDDAVREAMAGVSIVLSAQANQWKAWQGFNLSHSLGLMVFGGGLLWMAIVEPDLFFSNWLFQVVVIVIALLYFIFSKVFWFWGPLVASGAGSVCFILAALLS